MSIAANKNSDLHKELRVGNWVKWLKHHFQFTGTTMYGSGQFGIENRILMPLIDHRSTYDQVAWEDLHPIPITHEILIACGFEKSESDMNWKSPEYEIHWVSGLLLGVKDGRYFHYNSCEDDFYSWYSPEFLYLHQLQNYYFAVNGKELSYNPIN